MDIMSLIVSLISGAVGGNAAGAVMKDKSLGPLGNSIAGILGGGLGGGILQMLGLVATNAEAAGFDVTRFVESVAGGGVGGAVLLAVVAMAKKAAAVKK
jgi:uncharacterized membrane protein YeaQ/YmgE (transglycosylase-associated protein family)